MPVNRADYGVKPHPPKFIDLSLDFDLEPESGMIGIVTDEAAVAQFLRCLMLTDQGEWAFESNNGTRISRQLFGLADSAALLILSETIKLALSQKAPMVQLLDIKINKTQDESGLVVELIWRIITNPDRINSTLVTLGSNEVLTRIG